MVIFFIHLGGCMVTINDSSVFVLESYLGETLFFNYNLKNDVWTKKKIPFNGWAFYDDCIFFQSKEYVRYRSFQYHNSKVVHHNHEIT